MRTKIIGLIGVMMLLSCVINVSCDATVETYDITTGTGTIGPGGCVE